jgi:hypothetical protein
VKRLFAILFCTALLVGALWAPAMAGSGPKPTKPPDKTCDDILPAGIKTDIEDGHPTLVVNAPAGTVFDQVCVKAGSANSGYGPEFFSGCGGLATCTISHSSGKDISHWSYTTKTLPPPPPPPPPDPVCEDEAALNYGEEGECEYAPPPPPPPPPPPTPPPVCQSYNVGTWYECNTGNSTYTATSAGKCWCQGLTGRVHYHTTYDCGKTYVEEGNWKDAPESLGYYPAPVCAIGGGGGECLSK